MVYNPLVLCAPSLSHRALISVDTTTLIHPFLDMQTSGSPSITANMLRFMLVVHSHNNLISILALCTCTRRSPISGI